MKYTATIRKSIEATGMSIIEYAKDCLRNGLEYSEAIAQDHMTHEEKEEYRQWKIAYINELLKDCPF